MNRIIFSVFILCMALLSSGCVHKDQITYEGERLRFIDDLNASRTSYDQLVANDPLNATAWCIRGNYYNDAFGQYDEALVSYNRSLELDPENAYCWFSKGITLQNMKRLDEAEICFENAKKFWFSPGMTVRG